MRETLFNWLGQDLEERRCLDLFAGTGALGLEALSRGAASVVAVDRSRVVAAALREAGRLLSAEGYELHACDALEFLAGDRRRYDVIFVDPPYADPVLDKLWQPLADHLESDGVVYVEQPRPVAAPPGWEVVRSDRAGAVYYHLLRCINRGPGRSGP